VTTATPAAGDYDAYADQYEAFVAKRERAGPEADPYGLLPPLLDLLGDIAGRQVLDAGCGEGYLARALAARGAHVTGIDLSPRLIELARARDPGGRIDYQVGDLSQPRPTAVGRFDAVGYRGLWEAGIEVYHHHRTLENYLDAFHAGGLRLTKLTDVVARADAHRPEAYLPPGGRFPRFMLLAFSKS
jgi:SAM-dependent methyltransferase